MMPLLSKLKNLLIAGWAGLLVLLLSVAFFLLASSFNYLTQSPDFVKWISPDETANYIVTKLYAQEGKLSIYEKYNQQMSDIIRPRSFRSDLGVMKPMSFLGIVLVFGTLAKVLSVKAIPFMTPAFAAVGLIFYYLFLKRLFNRRVALLSAAILAVFPVYVYYSMRSMFHNVLFIVFFTASLYAGAEMLQVRKYPWANQLFSLFGGLMAGLAIATRTSELLWFGPLLALLWIGNIRRIGVLKLVVFVFGIVLAYLPVYHYNQALYDSGWRGGYAEMNKSLSVITDASKNFIVQSGQSYWQVKKEAVVAIFNNLFVFGFNTYQSLRYFYYYFAKMFSWLAVGSMLGTLFFVFQAIWKFFFYEKREAGGLPVPNRWSGILARIAIKKHHVMYVIGLVMTSSILVFYYGSWKFNDNPDPKAFTIGNSYTRYWLPLYMGTIPLLSYALIFISRIFQRRLWLPREGGKFLTWRFDGRLLSASFCVIAFAGIAIWSLNYLYFGSSEGIAYTIHKQQAARLEGQSVLSLTPGNSVIITRYHDKIFFPERKVIVGVFDDENMNRYYGQLAKTLPTYYYNFTFPRRDFDYLNSRRLNKFGFRLEVIKEVTSDFTLYKLDPIVATTSSSSIVMVKK